MGEVYNITHITILRFGTCYSYKLNQNKYIYIYIQNTYTYTHPFTRLKLTKKHIPI